jgi:hypothetical protein
VEMNKIGSYVSSIRMLNVVCSRPPLRPKVFEVTDQNSNMMFCFSRRHTRIFDTGQTAGLTSMTKGV